MSSPPHIRLAYFPVAGATNALKTPLSPPTLRLAHCDGAQGDDCLKGRRGVPQVTPEDAPALLVSYFYLQPFLDGQADYVYRDWVMDSGAFSAKQSGAEIDLGQYILTCRRLLAEDPTLTEVFALDVIGDHAASAENARIMREEGIPAIPCFHYGSPVSALMDMAERYDKIAIGGCAMMPLSAKMKFATEVFARVWPKKIHGFGFGSERAIMGLPFHSVDATSWEIGPCKFGSWSVFGNLPVRGGNQNLASEIRHYRKIEDRARVRWKKEMAALDSTGAAPSMRLAEVPNMRSHNLKGGRVQR